MLFQPSLFTAVFGKISVLPKIEVVHSWLKHDMVKCEIKKPGINVQQEYLLLVLLENESVRNICLLPCVFFFF